MVRWFTLLTLLGLACPPSQAGTWPQFRGPGGQASPDADRPLPDEIGPMLQAMTRDFASDLQKAS